MRLFLLLPSDCWILNCSLNFPNRFPFSVPRALNEIRPIKRANSLICKSFVENLISSCLEQNKVANFSGSMAVYMKKNPKKLKDGWNKKMIFKSNKLKKKKKTSSIVASFVNLYTASAPRDAIWIKYCSQLLHTLSTSSASQNS